MGVIRNILSSSLVLVLLAGLLISACSEDRAVRLRYEAEKKYSQADKLAGDTRIRDELNTPARRDSIRSLYGEVLTFAYNAADSVDPDVNATEYQQLNSLAHHSAIRICQLYFAEREYDSCVVILNDLLRRARMSRTEAMSVFVNLGQSLQASGNWDSAVAVYSHATDTFDPPVDDSGKTMLNLFNIPLHIQHIYSITNDTHNADQYFTQAEKYYSKYLDGYPGTDLMVASHGNLSRLYYDNKHFAKAITHLHELTDSSGNTTSEALLRIADIYAGELSDYDTALVLYEDLEVSLVGRDTALVPVIMFRKSLTLLEMKQYGEARQLLVDLAAGYPAYYEYNPTAQYLKARTFELEKNWDRAETEYKFLIDLYPESKEAMSTHLYLAEQLEARGRSYESEQWYQKAESYFSQLAQRGSGTAVEAQALMFKADMFRKQNKWSEAAEVLSSLFDKYPKSKLGRDAVLTAAAIQEQKLNNKPAADSLVELFKSSFTPDLSERE